MVEHAVDTRGTKVRFLGDPPFYLSVAQSGQSTPFGAEGSWVQILPGRPLFIRVWESLVNPSVLETEDRWFESSHPDHYMLG